MARRRGWDARGLDPFAPAAEFRSFKDVEQSGFRPDLVTFWHSLEHFDDPREPLKAAERLLGGAGRIFVSVPNIASLQSRWGGPAWFHLDVPRHRVHFTRTSLRLAAEAVGRDAHFSDSPVWEYEPAGWAATAANRILGPPNALYNLLKHHAPEARTCDYLAAAATLLLLPVLIPWSIAMSLRFRGEAAGIIEAVLTPRHPATADPHKV
jgi:hypothetical protein